MESLPPFGGAMFGVVITAKNHRAAVFGGNVEIPFRYLPI
jgi:hypothetical protein